ncbi:MAG: glycosyltransferase family 2 protein [Thermoprotei archaeon]
MNPKVSLYVPCYNCTKYLPATLAGILNQTHAPSEVIVVDDGSTDGLSSFLQSQPEYREVILVRHARNKGLAAARNTGIRSSSYEIVAALDADAIPSRDWLEKLLSYIDKGFAGAQGRLIEMNCGTIPDLWRCTHMAQGGPKLIVNPPYLYGNNTVFRKEYLTQGYDERCMTSGEDIDICKKIRARGGKLIYDPSVKVYHQKKDSITSLAKTYWYYGHPIHSIGGEREFIWNLIRYTHFATHHFVDDALHQRIYFLPFDSVLWRLWIKQTVTVYKLSNRA